MIRQQINGQVSHLSYQAVSCDLMALYGMSVAMTGFTHTIIQIPINPPKARNTCLKHKMTQLEKEEDRAAAPSAMQTTEEMDDLLLAARTSTEVGVYHYHCKSEDTQCTDFFFLQAQRYMLFTPDDFIPEGL